MLINNKDSIMKKFNKAQAGIAIGIIVGDYNKCYCGLVNKTKQPFKDSTYCHCGVGHIKQFFESAFGKPVKVELVQSVITGAESCKFLIHT